MISIRNLSAILCAVCSLFFTAAVYAQFHLPSRGPTASVSPTGVNTTGNYTVSWGRHHLVPNYQLQERVNNGNWRQVYTALSSSPTSYVVTSKSPGTYRYRVRYCTVNFHCSPYGSVLTVTITKGTVAAPTISPSGGTHVGSVRVSLSTSTSGATIRYTTNGSAVTTSSPVYSGPFTLNTSRTVRARAYRSGMYDSSAVSRAFTVLPPPKAPVISPSGGSYYESLKVEMSTDESDVTLRYTTNGSAVTSSSPVYSGPITVSNTTRIRARAFKSTVAGAERSAYFNMMSHGSVGTDYRYDALGRLIEMQDSNNHKSIYDYDDSGNRTSIERSQ